MTTFHERPVFTAAGVEYSWGDVVRAARFWGDWARVEDRARREAAVLEGDVASEVSDEDVQAAADQFRYDRDLVAAQDMEDWLSRWELDLSSFLDWVLSDLLLKSLAEPPAPDQGEDLAPMIHTEAVCSGALSRLAQRLAGRVAVHQMLVPGWAPGTDRDALIRAVEESYRSFRSEVVTPSAQEARLRAHLAEWTRVECRSLSFESAEAAREAILGLKEDGLTLEEVAADAGTEVERRQVLLEEIDESVRLTLLSARPGELVGPVKSGSPADRPFELFVVEDKVLPSLSDPVIARRAEASLLAGAVGREVDDRIRWRWPL